MEKPRELLGDSYTNLELLKKFNVFSEYVCYGCMADGSYAMRAV